MLVTWTALQLDAPQPGAPWLPAGADTSCLGRYLTDTPGDRP